MTSVGVMMSGLGDHRTDATCTGGCTLEKRQDLELESVIALPSRLVTSTLFSPVVVVEPQITIAINAANFGGEQEAAALGMAGAAINLG